MLLYVYTVIITVLFIVLIIFCRIKNKKQKKIIKEQNEVNEELMQQMWKIREEKRGN